MINNIDKHLQFKISQEKNNTITYLNLSGNITTNNIQLNIYRKPTYIDITIHFTSKHPFDQKLASLIFYIKRMSTMPIMEQAKRQKWNKITYRGYLVPFLSSQTYNPRTEKKN